MRLAKDLSGVNDTHLLDLRPEPGGNIGSNPLGIGLKGVFGGKRKKCRNTCSALVHDLRSLWLFR